MVAIVTHIPLESAFGGIKFLEFVVDLVYLATNLRPRYLIGGAAPHLGKVGHCMHKVIVGHIGGIDALSCLLKSEVGGVHHITQYTLRLRKFRCGGPVLLCSRILIGQSLLVCLDGILQFPDILNRLPGLGIQYDFGFGCCHSLYFIKIECHLITTINRIRVLGISDVQGITCSAMKVCAYGCSRGI